MATTSVSKIKVNLSGDVTYGQEFASASNASSRGINTLETLAAGNNTIATATADTAIIIIPPAGNTIVLTLKGVAGDTGISIHRTNPTLIALNSVTSIVINAVSQVVGVRIIKI